MASFYLFDDFFICKHPTEIITSNCFVEYTHFLNTFVNCPKIPSKTKHSEFDIPCITDFLGCAYFVPNIIMDSEF